MTKSRFKIPVVEDAEYLKSYRNTVCEACGIRDGSVVGHHIRVGQGGGTSMKPSDDLTIGLCHRCHQDVHAAEENEWLVANILKRQLRTRYQKWSTQTP